MMHVCALENYDLCNDTHSLRGSGWATEKKVLKYLDEYYLIHYTAWLWGWTGRCGRSETAIGNVLYWVLPARHTICCKRSGVTKWYGIGNGSFLHLPLFSVSYRLVFPSWTFSCHIVTFVLAKAMFLKSALWEGSSRLLLLRSSTFQPCLPPVLPASKQQTGQHSAVNLSRGYPRQFRHR